MDNLNIIQGILCDIFDDKSITITRDSSLDEIDGWDSLAKVNFIAACESEFDIRFDINEIIELKDVEHVLNIISQRR